MYDIDANIGSNTLYIDLSGRMDADEIAEAVDETTAKAERLDVGFDVITDLSGFRPPSPEAATPIKRAQATLEEMEVVRVVRIADEDTSEVVVNAFERRSKDVGYGGERADSVAEAERLLERQAVSGHQG